MKIILLVFGLSILFCCTKKEVYCVEIGQNLKRWTVYEEGDTFSMHDGLGNTKEVILSRYYDKPGFVESEKGGLSKTSAKCQTGMQLATEDWFFNLVIGGLSSQSGEKRYPNKFTVSLTVGDVISNFRLTNEYGIENLITETPETSSAIQYQSGNEIYSKVFIYHKDSAVSPENVYRFVYAKDKGLIEFSTKYPATTWVVD